MLKTYPNISRAVLCIAGLFLFGYTVLAKEKNLTILFTNDIHSSGDYARMATLIKQERGKAQQMGSPVVLVDAGDMAMGSAFHVLFGEYAFEYATMAKMGYDAYTFGNHDFDFGLKTLEQMFTRARKEPNRLPALLVANVDAVHDSGFRQRIGMKDTLVLRKHLAEGEGDRDITIGLFGLMGNHAYSCITCKDSLLFLDRESATRSAVAALENKEVDYIICLSHGGTMWADGKKIESGTKKAMALRGKSEDGKLAKAVPQLNAIISGHDHQTLFSPLVFGKTAIGSSGSKNSYLGKMLFEGDSLREYQLIPVTEDVVPDSLMQAWVDLNSRRVIDKFYMYNDIYLHDTIAFLEQGLPLDVDDQGNMDLGLFIADSYRVAALKYSEEIRHMMREGGERARDAENVVAIVPYGVIRQELAQGHVTYNDIFNLLSLGMTSGGNAGYPLVLAWVSGKELKDICELNASVASGMEDARLFFSGMTFEYNRYKLPFTRVTRVLVNGEPVEKNKLYPVVTGMYTARLMGLLRSSSYGLLSVEPKDKEGNLISDFNEMVLKKMRAAGLDPENGDSIDMDITEWFAFADYIQKTGLKNPAPDKCAADCSNPSAFLLYFLIFGLIILIIWRLWFGKR